MKILSVITYYRPHMSGLTIYAERLAKALVKAGHSVTVLSSQFDSDLPLNENMEGVNIVRVPVKLHISKGGLMPAFGSVASKLIKENDIVHLHTPQFDAARVAVRASFQKKPIVITHHCDLQMPKGAISWLANQSVLVSNNVAAFFADRIITYTQDYADHSGFVRRFNNKQQVINPPVILPEATTEEIKTFKQKHDPTDHHPVIGMAARFASEKGVEVLLDAMKSVIAVFPHAQVWFAGPYENIMEEQNYYLRLKPTIDAYIASGNWKFLGLLSPHEMAIFYPNLDILAIPSLNSTEAFGLIQIEAMMNGVPCIASNLPGVRRPVQRHNMGEVIQIGNSEQLANAIIKIMADKKKYRQGWQNIAAQYTPESAANAYIDLYKELIDN